MSKTIQAVRGMNDIVPAHSAYWTYCETTLQHVAEQYGYQMIRFPIVEQTALFKRAVGEVTDIVEKEMYTFDDRNGDSLSLRPEGTASCVRAALEQGLLHNQVQRLWYLGPMFRHERPQQGRYRQFYQYGIEAMGIATPDIDAEVIALSARIWQVLGLQDNLSLQLNSLGTVAERDQYRQALVVYLQQHVDQLDADSQRRLTSNPLRILDSKNPDVQALLKQAPRLDEYLGEDSKNHFSQVCQLLDGLGIAYTINPYLVRGLDYYSHTVFEWVTENLGAQGTVCAGGRYDGLVEQLGGKPTPAVGFSLGLERLISLIEQQTAVTELDAAVDVYLVVQNAEARQHAFLLSERLRSALPHTRFLMHCGDASMKSQFKRADKSGAQTALIIGDDEVAQGTVTVKSLRSDAEQQVVALSDVVDFFEKQFSVD